MKKIPSPKGFLFATAGVWVLGGALVFFQNGSVGEEQTKLAKVKAEYKDEKKVKQELATSQQDLQKLQERLAHLEKGVQDYAYIPTLLRQLEETGKTCGLQVVGVRPIPPKLDPNKKDAAKKPYDELDVEVASRGKFGKVTAFLGSLGNFPKIVAVRSVTMQPKSDPMHPFAQPDLDAIVTIRAYLFKDGSKPTSTATGGKA